MHTAGNSATQEFVPSLSHSLLGIFGKSFKLLHCGKANLAMQIFVAPLLHGTEHMCGKGSNALNY